MRSAEGSFCSFMKTSLALALSASAALFLISSTSSAAIVKYKATINGAQQVPPVESASTGTADLSFDDANNTLRGTIEFQLAEGTNVTNQHIHQAKCGESGSILKPLTEPGLNGVIAIEPPFELDAAGVAALQAGELYINLHTEAHAGGEIRGQIYPADSTETCPPSAGGGDDAGTSSSGGAADGGTEPTAPAEDDGGCSTTGNASTSNGIILATGVALALGALGRRRKK